jgi:hypothetical protein
MPVILTTQEAETGRIIVQGRPRQKVQKIPSQPMAKCDGMHPVSHLGREALTGGCPEHAK